MEDITYIGVDLDGTLSYYDVWRGKEHIGDPIPLMLKRVNMWRAAGKIVKCFTARAAEPENIPYVREWLDRYDLKDVDITCIKDQYMVEFWDDRAIQVKPNTGIPVIECIEKSELAENSDGDYTKNMKYYMEYLKEEMSPERARELYNLGRKIAAGTHQSVSKILTSPEIMKLKSEISEKVLARTRLLSQWKVAIGPAKEKLKQEILSLEKTISSHAKQLKDHERELHVNKIIQSKRAS